MLKKVINPKVDIKFQSYPPLVRDKLEQLRALIFETAEGIQSIVEIEETLKWGEPSYLVKKGSTIRIDWKTKTPDQYAIYFKCTSKLVPTFKLLYSDIFSFEKNRAIVFDLNEDDISIKELKACIAMALQYHLLKEKPLLGAERK